MVFGSASATFGCLLVFIIAVIVAITIFIIYFKKNIIKTLAKKEAKPHSAPYFVSIQRETKDGRVSCFCGGTIIEKNWVLTAAHCIDAIVNKGENCVLVAGLHKVNSTSDCVQRRNIDYDLCFKHPQYTKEWMYSYDIALIHIKVPFEFTEYVQPIELAKPGDLAPGPADLYGFGNISATEVPLFPSELQTTTLPILPMTLCKGAYGDMMHELNFCSGPLSGGNGACNGDSGGPLVRDNKIVGIVSWGPKLCGSVNRPSVFVDVSSFTDWIKSTIKMIESVQ